MAPAFGEHGVGCQQKFRTPFSINDGLYASRIAHYSENRTRFLKTLVVDGMVRLHSKDTIFTAEVVTFRPLLHSGRKETCIEGCAMAKLESKVLPVPMTCRFHCM